VDDRYASALLDWLACAVGGRDEPAATAARAAGDGLLEQVACLGAAGHVLDFDDTYQPGLAHLSAPTAPAALAVAAELGAGIGDAMAAYAAGFEAMGALSRASHPALYERGWHPTAVCGAVGAAVASARLLGLDEERTVHAQRLTLLRAGGLRAAFGSDGKSLQVGMAAADGVLAARMAAAGATVSPAVAAAEPTGGFAAVLGGRWAAPAPQGRSAIDENWIKPWPCCLLAHGAIEAAASVRTTESASTQRLEVAVHPRAREAAAYDDVADGLQAKFSIPYLVAYTLLHGEPGVGSFGAVDLAARTFAAERVTVRTDPRLGESEAVIEAGGEEIARVAHSLGSPARPMSAAQLQAKVSGLAGTRLDGVLDDPARPAAEVLAAAGLGQVAPSFPPEGGTAGAPAGGGWGA
jgi:2-methylcitrate dehydratase PrpD